MTDEANALARTETQREVLENRPAVGIMEIDMLEFHAGAAMNEWLRLGVVAQIVWYEQRGDGLRQPGDMLGDVDQSHREVTRRAEHRERQRTGEYDIARRRFTLFP